MKTFLDKIETQDVINELFRHHKSYILENMEEIDPEVENQKTRLYKFWCWFKYGHLLKKNKTTCSRCGKVLTSKAT